MRAKWIGLSLLLGSVAAYATPACTSGSLSDYVALQSGCSFGPYVFSGFGFSTDGGSIGAGDVSVSPTQSSTGWGMDFSSSGFFVPPGETIEFTFTYQIDPPPPILRFDSSLTSPQIGIGALQDATIQMDTYLCAGSTVVSTSACSDSSPIYDLVTDLNNPQNSYLFPNPNSMISVMDVLTLTGNDTGGTVAGFTQIADAPEPATAALVVFGLAGLVPARRRFNARGARRPS